MKNLSNLEGFKSNFDLLPKIPMRMKLAAFCLTCFLSTASAPCTHNLPEFLWT